MLADAEWQRSRTPGVEVARSIVTGTGGGRPMHIAIARPTKPDKSPMPVVLWVHGGGWRRGSYENLPDWLAGQGYLVGSVEYRLSEESKWPAQIEDCKLAVRWLRANAEQLNIDPNRIGCWGTSAGGHLVAMLGTTAGDPAFEGSGGCAGVSSAVQAVADYCGPSDFTAPEVLQKDKSRENMSFLLTKSFEEDPDLWKQASPIFHVKAGAAPFLIMHGDSDKVVSPKQSERMADALKNAKLPVEYVSVKGGGHTFWRDGSAVEPNEEQIKTALLAFFEKHLKVESSVKN